MTKSCNKTAIILEWYDVSFVIGKMESNKPEKNDKNKKSELTLVSVLGFWESIPK